MHSITIHCPNRNANRAETQSNHSKPTTTNPTKPQLRTPPIGVATDHVSGRMDTKIGETPFHTGFLDRKKQAQGKEEADPYLLGYCQTHGYTLITDESRFKPIDAQL